MGEQRLVASKLEGHGLRSGRPSRGSDDVDDAVAWGMWLSDESEVAQPRHSYHVDHMCL